MKQSMMRPLILAFLFSAGVATTSCKNKAKETNTNTTTTTDQNNANTTAPEISGDETLRTGVNDAIKDHPNVTATVTNGEIILKGSIEKDKWIRLNQTLMSLNPKKVNSNDLTIK